MASSTTVDDKEIAEAAAKIDALAEQQQQEKQKEGEDSATDAAVTQKDQDHEEPKSIRGMLKLLHKHSDGTNVMKESITTFSNPDGSDKKGDLFVQSKEEALTKLKELIEFDITKNAKKPKKIKKWEFRTSPHEQFNKTLDDTFEAFVLWARSTSSFNDDDKADDEDGVAGYNVSKAFRRLVSYVEWMEDTEDDLVEPTLTADTIKPALDAWAMKCSVDSKNGNFCWWIDMAKIDVKSIKKDIPPKDSLRAFVWYAHYVMYNEAAQSKGMIFFESISKDLGFIQMCTMMPMKLGAKLDRLTIGVLPIKMNALYIFDSPRWLELFMKFMSLFMSKKMQQRIILTKDWSIVEPLVGKESIPKGFGQLEGSIEIDPVDAKYFSS